MRAAARSTWPACSQTCSRCKRLPDLSLAELESSLAQLDSDHALVMRFPELHQIETRLNERGLATLLHAHPRARDAGAVEPVNFEGQLFLPRVPVLAAGAEQRDGEIAEALEEATQILTLAGQ